jgi:hypothetical protein
MLYQLSHFRSINTPAVCGAESQDRTGDTAIFSRVLYQLSYLGPVRRTGSPSARGKVPRLSETLQGNAGGACGGPALGSSTARFRCSNRPLGG